MIRLFLAAFFVAAPIVATGQPAPNVVTLEDICIAGATEFTDERAVRVHCPIEAAQAPSNAYWADVCLERDHPNACMAEAYCEWRADLCPMVRRAMPGGVSDRELARIERAAFPRGYAPNDARCTIAYQIETRWRFWADDRPNCRGLRRLLRGQRRPATPEEENNLVRLLCDGPDGSDAAPIPDDDPALILFEGPRADRKIALSIERTNGCH